LALHTAASDGIGFIRYSASNGIGFQFDVDRAGSEAISRTGRVGTAAEQERPLRPGSSTWAIGPGARSRSLGGYVATVGVEHDGFGSDCHS
jgi:hypothetical protein